MAPHCLMFFPEIGRPSCLLFLWCLFNFLSEGLAFLEFGFLFLTTFYNGGDTLIVFWILWCPMNVEQI